MAEIVVADSRAISRTVLSSVAGIRAVTIILIWLVYEMVAQSGLFFEGVVPSSLLVLSAIGVTLSDLGFYPHLGQTALEVVVGFAIGAFIGVATGVIFGVSNFVGAMFNPWVQYLAPAPKIIFLPILMLLFGVGVGSKIAMAAISTFFPVVVTAYAAMLNIKGIYIRVARSFNARPLQMIAKVYLPSLVAPVVTSFRLGLGVAFVGTLLAEIKLSNIGLGHLIIQHYNFMRIPDMYAVLIITFAIAVAANSAMDWIVGRVEHDQ